MGIKEIIPLLAAVIGLTPVFLKWINDRSNEAANRRSIQQAKENVEFWQVWLQAQKDVSSAERFAELKIEVARRLDNLIQKTIETENREKSKKSGSQGHSFLQKAFLLYVPHSTSGWIFHTLFYIVISFTGMFLFGSSLPSDDINADPSWEVFINDIGIIAPMFFFFSAIAFVFQRLARRSERKYYQKINVQD